MRCPLARVEALGSRLDMPVNPPILILVGHGCTARGG